MWCWGAGTDGQLALANPQDQHLPQPLPSLPPISQLACGGAHVIALTKPPNKPPQILTWGRGATGQLGHAHLLNSPSPTPLPLHSSAITISRVAAGWNHSAFLSHSGAVFTCGDGSFGQLGHGDFQSHSRPLQISSFGDKFAAHIACGMRHSLVLFRGGMRNSALACFSLSELGCCSVYGFGSGKRGQLGVSKDKVRGLFNVPQLTLGLDGLDATAVFANGDHSAVLTVDGHLYTWGRGFNGASDANLPRLLPSRLKFTQVALGWNHALLLTDEGEVYMLGGDRHGMLTDPQKPTLEQSSSIQSSPCQASSSNASESELERVPGLIGRKVVNIAAGAEHSALVTENGEVMTWGWGEHGQLGLGNTEDQRNPQVVEFGNKVDKYHNHYRVFCGSGFTFAVK
ncbi:hypothetical protein Scep_017535 [Stephania cephalantha]|uniref:RCC1-like domain-containing protein n=1 Tax=Stephania cephalantha TaxID=152367 RepID=A0AAP0IPS2_9MAGN